MAAQGQALQTKYLATKCRTIFLAVSAQVIPPSQNSANSATDNLNPAHYYNHNFYARDESSNQPHSTTFGTNAGVMTTVTTGTSDLLPLPAIDPLYPNFPAQLPQFYHIAPYPVYNPVPNVQTHSTVYQLPHVSPLLNLSTSIMPLIPQTTTPCNTPCPSPTLQALSPTCC